MNRWRAAALTVLTLAVLGGCGDTNSTVSPPLPVPPPTRRPPPPPPSVIGDPSGCPVPEIRPVVEREIPMDEGIGLGDVQLKACRNDYAMVVLIPEDPKSTDPLPVFLKHTGNAWVIMGAGGGIDCEFPDTLSDQLVAACQALGL